MTDCPALSKITADTIAITKELVYELRLTTFNRSPGTRVGVSCQFDLELVGPATVTCGSNGLWSGSPYCRDENTATPSQESEDLDESTILLIVLIVVVVFVLAVIIVICVALYYGRWKRRRDKSKFEASYFGEDSMPYSISERNTTDTTENHNVTMYNIYGSQQHDNEAYRKSEIEQRDYRKSNIERPDYRKSDIERPDYRKSDIERPDYRKSDIERPDYRKSDIERPDYRKSDIERPDPDWPGYRKSGHRHTFDRFHRPKYDERKGMHRHHDDDRKQHRMYRSNDDITRDRNFRYQDLHNDEPREGRPMRSRDDINAHHYPERIYEKNRHVSRSPHIKRRRYKTKCPRCSHETEMRHARSVDDFETEEEYDDRSAFRRDNHLWHSMNSMSNWSIPRPYYGK